MEKSLKQGYKGYKAYDYLVPGEDYKVFNLAEEGNEFGEYIIPLTDEQEKFMDEIIAKHPMISLHEHPFCFPKPVTDTFDYAREGRSFTAYRALAESKWDCVFDNLMDGCCLITSKHGWKWNDVIYDLGMRLADISHQDFLIKCEKVDDIYRAKAEGKVAWVPVIEGAAMIENELDRIDMLYGFGVRLMGITYSESNGLGSGLKEAHDGGLTHLGYQVIDRMNKVGMAIDCAHVGDNTTLDIIEASTKPVFISHTGARALWNSKRLKSDEIIKACAAKGGVIGIEAAPHTTITEKHTTHDIEAFMEHFEYVKDLVGIDFVSFGPDTLYGDHVGLHHAFSANLSIKQAFVKQNGEGKAPSFPEVPYVKGLENPTEASYNIIRWLIKHNYSEQDIAKVMGGNAIRVLKEVW
ncbi:dipeptidase [Ligaoa zhengdingensis]|uniref:dipeptidase n=1 Tax=Ligaoa zhengdingensis TaxID=2763658 RepID=UPI0031BA243F